MARFAIASILVVSATAHAEPPDAARARTKIRYGKLGVAAGLVIAAAGGAIAYYHGDTCRRTGNADDCHTQEIVYPVFVGLPLMAGGLVLAGAGAWTWHAGARELRAAQRVTIAPVRGGTIVSVRLAF